MRADPTRGEFRVPCRHGTSSKSILHRRLGTGTLSPSILVIVEHRRAARMRSRAWDTSGPMPRTEVTKKLWAYIKKHRLQDPKNKRNIIPDNKLSSVFGSKKAINMFDMTKKVNKHLS